MKQLALAFGILLTSIVACGHEKTQPTTFMPPNNFNIPVQTSSPSTSTDATPNPAVGNKKGLTEDQFNQVLDRVQKIYSPVIQKLGGNYVIVRSWSDGTVNAQAWKEGNDWKVEMFGGMARYKGMSMDAFALVACHETGHHLGGAPRFSDSDMSVEGQADYFSTTKCAKIYMAMDDSKTIDAGIKVDPTVAAQCQKNNAKDYDLCIRASTAGKILGVILAECGEEAVMPDFSTPDKTVVTETFEDHPMAQCRLDTFFHAAQCTADPTTASSATDPNVGYCHGDDPGARPLCWFKP